MQFRSESTLQPIDGHELAYYLGEQALLVRTVNGDINFVVLIDISEVEATFNNELLGLEA